MPHFPKFLDFLHVALATKHVPKASWHVPNGAGGARSGHRAPQTPRRTPGASTACTFSKNHFFTKNALPERPGSLPKSPADAHGTALEPPRVARGGPRARFSPKIVPKCSKMHEKWNLPWIFEIDTIFHHFLHGFWKFFRGVFRCVFRPCVFEKVPLLQSATCQDTMVFTMDSNDSHVSRFSRQGKKNRDSSQNFDAKNVANSGQKFLENPMPKIMEFH